MSVHFLNAIQCYKSYFRLEAQLRNVSSKSFDALNDKNTIEYESINPEEFTSMFLHQNEGINQILNV